MLAIQVLIIISIFLSEASCSPPLQVPLQQQTKPRKLQGRFLHISDQHPDPHYIAHSAISTACHRQKNKKKKNISGYYGTAYSECDSPFQLTNFTLDFLDENWASEIDFVVWTGDNARHDNDPHIPRTPNEIYLLNRAVASKMADIFLARGIPVVPSLGNNDVWPHNIMMPGPNSITNEYASIWSKFIPFPYLQVFQRGAHYSVEVIPNSLAVISLNTMYFYDSNKVVSGCLYQAPDDPGNLQLDWLEVQLEMYRSRDMQVWLSGHVPPSPGNYFPECYVRYVELSLRFQDTILGHLYGHMNYDYFFFLEASDLQITPEEDEWGPANNIGLFDTLMEDFEALPDHKQASLDDYAVVNVVPAASPNPYIPGFRIYSYNISASENGGEITTSGKRKHGHRRGRHGDKRKHCKTEPYRNSWKCRLKEPWGSDPFSPSRSNQRWTPTGYAQFYLPSIAEANEERPPHYELEYVTHRLERLHPERQEMSDEFNYPIPVRHLPEGLRNSTWQQSKKRKYAPYEMDDLTIPSWMQLARNLVSDGKLQRKFGRYMFLGGEKEL